MLREMELFGPRDMVQIAIDRLKHFEREALSMHPDGYYVAFSGGKDSIVVLDLVKKAGVKYTAHFNLTTVDPPELLQFVLQHYPDVTRHRPEKTMWQLIVEKHMPPTRKVKYCCGELKERGGSGRMVVTGIRWAESVRRQQRSMTETCYQDKTKRYLHPIIDWQDADVWQYIRENSMPYCSLYDEGFARVGCIMCPSPGGKRQAADALRWPRFKVAYIRAFDKMIAKRKAD